MIFNQTNPADPLPDFGDSAFAAARASGSNVARTTQRGRRSARSTIPPGSAGGGGPNWFTHCVLLARQQWEKDLTPEDKAHFDLPLAFQPYTRSAGRKQPEYRFQSWNWYAFLENWYHGEPIPLQEFSEDAPPAYLYEWHAYTYSQTWNLDFLISPDWASNSNNRIQVFEINMPRWLKTVSPYYTHYLEPVDIYPLTGDLVRYIYEPRGFFNTKMPPSWLLRLRRGPGYIWVETYEHVEPE
jgi:hypothetical protein